MRVGTWNINSIRVRLAQVLDWMHAAQPDLLCLQETKCTDADFPYQMLAATGYHVLHAGQKGYNGVAILSREAAREPISDLPEVDPAQKRLLAATVAGVRVLNIYVPNGEAVGSDKFRYKLGWLKAFKQFLSAQLKAYPELMVVGDFNIAPEERDVHDPRLWQGQIMFSSEERQVFRELLALGLVDVFRKFEQPEASFTWWDYRQGAFRRNLGLRIDHILCSSALAMRCGACRIDKDPRKLDRPSDHAPVMAEFKING